MLSLSCKHAQSAHMYTCTHVYMYVNIYMSEGDISESHMYTCTHVYMYVNIYMSEGDISEYAYICIYVYMHYK